MSVRQPPRQMPATPQSLGPPAAPRQQSWDSAVPVPVSDVDVGNGNWDWGRAAHWTRVIGTTDSCASGLGLPASCYASYASRAGRWMTSTSIEGDSALRQTSLAWVPVTVGDDGPRCLEISRHGR